MTWLYIYAGIGVVFAVISMIVGNIGEPWHVRACVYVGLMVLWPLWERRRIAKELSK